MNVMKFAYLVIGGGSGGIASARCAELCTFCICPWMCLLRVAFYSSHWPMDLTTLVVRRRRAAANGASVAVIEQGMLCDSHCKSPNSEHGESCMHYNSSFSE